LPGFVRERWHADFVVNHGTVMRPAECPGLVARLDGERVGLLTYHVDAQGLEVVSLDSPGRESASATPCSTRPRPRPAGRAAVGSGW